LDDRLEGLRLSINLNDKLHKKKTKKKKTRKTCWLKGNWCFGTFIDAF